MRSGELLLELQHLDQEIAQAQRRLSEITASLGETGALRQARQALQAAQEEHRNWQAKSRDLELEIEALSNKLVTSENRLYSGNVKNPKELRDIQDEIASLKRRRNVLEDNLLEVMVEGEEAENNLNMCSAALNKNELDWQADQASLKEESSALESRLVDAREERDHTRKSIADDDLGLYDKVQSRYGSVTVATLRDGVCGYCAVAPSSTKLGRLRSGRELLQCGNCGRILLDL